MRLLAEGGSVLRVAHRGASALAPENSLAALAAALEHDIDLVEFDVCERDGELVLGHSTEQAVADAPTLDEALAFLAKRAPPTVGFDVDLKWWGFEERAVEALRRHGVVERSLVCSFFTSSLREVRRLEPGLAVGVSYPLDRHRMSERGYVPEAAIRAALGFMRRTLPRRIESLLDRADADAAMLHQLVLSRKLVERCHACGAAVFAWTMNDADAVASVLDLGVDGVISDDPRLFT